MTVKECTWPTWCFLVILALCESSSANTATMLTPCPEPPTRVIRSPEIDSQNKGFLTCMISKPLGRGTELKFTIMIEGIDKTWSKTVETPVISASFPTAELNMDLLDKKITCLATATQIGAGGQKCWEKSSQVLEPKIECKPGGNSDVVTVVEGRDSEILTSIKSTVPPAFLCRLGADQCDIQVLAEVEVVNNEKRCSNKLIPQFVLGTKLVDSQSKKVCGQTLDNANWQQGVSIPVKATVDGKTDGDQTRNVKLTVRVSSQADGASFDIQCGRIPVKIIDKDKRAAVCRSVNDPHIATFDGEYYDNHIPGEFVLYQHKSLPYEVRAMYKKCNLGTSGPACNCAAAVKSGDDVITFDTCNNRVNKRRRGSYSAIELKVYKNGEFTPGTKIYHKGNGVKHKVILPTGTQVTISSSYRTFMNIHIQGAATDFDQVQGLCGNYNGQRNDDIKGASRYSPDTFSKTWKRTETIFQGVLASASPQSPEYCSCLKGHAHICQSGLDTNICSQPSPGEHDCTDTLLREASVPVLNKDVVPARNKRDTDEQSSTLTTGPGNSKYNKSTGEEYCRNYLESKTTVKVCVSYLDQTAVNQSVSNCAMDLAALGDEMWAESHLDDLTLQCIVSAYQEETNMDEETSIPEVIRTGLCLRDCGKDGNCLNGVCECNKGFSGEMCEISQETVPEVLPAISTCDLLTSDCSQIQILGYNFVPTPNLTCHYQFVKIIRNVEIDNGEKAEQTMKADFVGMNQLICSLPSSASNATGRSAFVTISNDGVKKSDVSYLHVAVMSSCQECALSANGSDAVCSVKSGFCLIEGVCYNASVTSTKDECYMCDPGVSVDSWSKSSGAGCSDDDVNLVTIVVVTLCGVLALALIVGLSLWCVHRARRHRKLVFSKVTTVDAED